MQQTSLHVSVQLLDIILFSENVIVRLSPWKYKKTAVVLVLSNAQWLFEKPTASLARSEKQLSLVWAKACWYFEADQFLVLFFHVCMLL